MMKVKLFDKETKGFGSIDLPDGKYLFEIVDVEPSPAKSGRPRLQLRLRTVEGPVTDTTAFDWWNLPEPTDAPDSFTKNFWRDVVKAWPFIYDEAKEQLDENLLKGLQFRGTVSHEEDNQGVMRMRVKSYRFVGKIEAGAGSKAGTEETGGRAEGKPPKYAQP